MKRPPLFRTSYAVSGGDVFLTVLIGEGQLGASAVRLEGREIARGTITDLRLGGAELAGREIAIKSVVTDTNEMTNRTSVRYLLRGGLAPVQHDLRADVDAAGDSVVYHAEIEFTA